MSFDYADIAATADEILREFGAAGLVTRKVPGGDYDPDTGTTPDAEVSQNVTAVVFAYPQHLVNGTTVLQGDEQAYLSAVGLVMPKATDVFLWQGISYTVISAKPLAPAGVNVLAELQVRR